MSLTDGSVKAADSGMTAAFGTLVNDSSADVHIVSADSSVASAIELHEVAADDTGAMVMREKDDGFVVPAGAPHQLDPVATTSCSWT